MNNLPSMNAEERLIAQQKAQASRDAKKMFAEANMVLEILYDW